jgi:hypothetical protein
MRRFFFANDFPFAPIDFPLFPDYFANVMKNKIAMTSASPINSGGKL